MKNRLQVLGLVAATFLLHTGLTARDAATPLGPKGAETLKHLNAPEPAASASGTAAKSMSCSMCKDTPVVRHERSRGREIEVAGVKHGCSQCGLSVQSVGQRLDKHDVVRHTCGDCGGSGAGCCADSKHAAHAP